MKIRLTSDDLARMSLFSTITKVAAVDSFETEDGIVFLVRAEDMGKAIGKGGKTADLLSQAFGKRVMIFPYAKDLSVFLRLLFPEMKEFKEGEELIVTLPRSKAQKNRRFLNIKRMIVKRILKKDVRFRWS